MRKKILVAVWLLVPIVLLAVHYGPGQKGLARDQVAAKLAQARQAEQAEDWARAVKCYREALAALPADQHRERYQLRLAQAKARLLGGELPEAVEDLQTLLADLLKSGAEPDLTKSVRGHLAGAQYYAGWLMRLEGAALEEWMPEVEAARQNFRLLAEQTKAEGRETQALDFQKNLEATVRLQLMDLSELQGLPLPKECQNCSNCTKKRRQQRESNCKAPSQSEDVREKIAEDKRKGAGSSSREGSGS